MTAYANDVPCYIASRRVIGEGGYEVTGSMPTYDKPAALAPEVEDLIVATVHELLPGRLQSQQVDSARLQAAVDYLREAAGKEGVKRMVIVRNGRIIWRGTESDEPQGVWSITKAFTSTAHGLLIEDGDGHGGGSGNVWCARFTPDEAGRWSYEASFRAGRRIAVSLDPEAGRPIAFDRAGGSFDVAPCDQDAPGFLN